MLWPKISRWVSVVTSIVLDGQSTRHVYTLDVGHSNKHYMCLTNHIYVIWTPYHMVEESPSETQIVAKFNWVYATQLCGSISKVSDWSLNMYYNGT